MNTNLKSILVAILILGAGSAAMADIQFGVRTDNFYFSVGKYDYYPYGVAQGYRPRISFSDVMSDYGYWVYYQPFGRVWRPYADYRWRPYLYGHWIYTQYGPTWQGYEPWAWVGYHYGDWVWTQYYGWVWIPGYDWHPGRVAWSYGSDEIGWMPAPPQGYGYNQGGLRYYGDSYRNNGYYGDDYRYDSDPNINVNLWVFINTNNFHRDNYSDCYLDRNRTRDLFSRRAVRINSRPFQRTELERIVKRRVEEVPVEVREVETERKSVRMVIPKGEEEHIRKNAKKVVQDVIKPAFEKEHRNFKGQDVHNEKAVERIFKQKPAEIKKPRSSDDRDDKDRSRQFEDRQKQGSSEEQRRFEQPDNSKRYENLGHRNENPVEDRSRYLGPPQKKESDSKSHDFGERNRENEAPQQQKNVQRDRDAQFEKPPQTSGSPLTLEPPNTGDSKDRNKVSNQDDSKDRRKQADKKKDSDRKRQKDKDKDKKKQNDDVPNRDRRL